MQEYFKTKMKWLSIEIVAIWKEIYKMTEKKYFLFSLQWK